MSFQRVILNPLRRFTRVDQTPHDGIPPTWDRDDLPALPEGQEWFEIQSAPEYDAATQRVEQVLDPVAKKDGWRVIDLTPEEIAARDIPAGVTRRQLFLVVYREKGISRAQIKALLAGNEEALIELEEAQQFERRHPLVESLGAALGLSAGEVDELFKAAAGL